MRLIGKIRILFYILRHPVRVTVSSCQLMLCLRTDDANFLWPCHVTVSCDCYEIWSRSLGVIILKKFDMYVTYVIVPTTGDPRISWLQNSWSPLFRDSVFQHFEEKNQYFFLDFFFSDFFSPKIFLDFFNQRNSYL